MDTTIIVDGERRRNWPIEVKLKIVEESCAPDVSVSEVARRHDLDPAQLFAWRRKFGVSKRQSLDFLPVEVTEEAVSVCTDGDGVGKIIIEFSNGRRLLIPASMDCKRIASLAQALDRQ